MSFAPDFALFQCRVQEGKEKHTPLIKNAALF